MEQGTRAAAAEFGGTALFVGTALSLPLLSLYFPVPPPLAWGLSLAFLVMTIGGISGAHVNPAVTLGMAVSGRLPLSALPSYWTAQFLGAVAGVLGAAGFVAKSWDKELAQSFIVQAKPNLTMGEAFLREAIATCAFTWIVIAASNKLNGTAFSWLPCGIAISAAIWWLAPETGGSLNPARALAPVLVAWEWDNLFYLLVAHMGGPFAGALVAGLLCWPFSSSSPDMQDA